MPSHVSQSPSPVLSERRTRTAHHILGTAMRLVAERGVASLTMSALAHEAGVSRQTLYTYFPDVEAVLAALVQAGGAGDTELTAPNEGEQDPHSALRLFIEAIVSTAAAGHPSPSALAPALPADLRDAITQHEEHVRRLLTQLLRRGRDAGHFRADLEPELEGRLLLRMITAGAELAAEPGADAGSVSAHLVAGVYRMVTT